MKKSFTWPHLVVGEADGDFVPIVEISSSEKSDTLDVVITPGYRDDSGEVTLTSPSLVLSGRAAEQVASVLQRAVNQFRSRRFIDSMHGRRSGGPVDYDD